MIRKKSRTPTKDIEQTLRMRALQQSSVAHLGQLALEGAGPQKLMDEASRLVKEVLQVEYIKILELLPDKQSLLLRSGAGWEPDLIGQVTLPAGLDSLSGYTLQSSHPVIVSDLRTETRFQPPLLLQNRNIVSGISVIISGSHSPFGVLSAHTIHQRTFTEDDINFLQAIANILAMAIERNTLERRKDEFIGIASHELKTPVTSLKLYSQILQRELSKSPDHRGQPYLARMDVQINKLTSLVSDLLDVSKIQSGKMALQKDYFDINQLIDELVNDLQQTTTQHQISIKGKIKGQVFADRDRISQVFINLLSNGIKYSPHSDQILVHLTQNPHHLTISVVDKGIGLSSEDQEKIFQPFYRVDTTKSERFFGLGLGLYIASEIIKQHGGSIGLHSELNQGSTFYFNLPHP